MTIEDVNNAAGYVSRKARSYYEPFDPAVRAIGRAFGALADAASVTGDSVWRNRSELGNQWRQGLADDGIKLKTIFDVPLGNHRGLPIVGSQSATLDPLGNFEHTVDAKIGGGKFIAIGEEFRLFGSGDAPSTWGIGGGGGRGRLAVAIDVRMDGIWPVEGLIFVGVGRGQSFRLEPPEVQTRVFTITRDREGNWNGGFGRPEE